MRRLRGSGCRTPSPSCASLDTPSQRVIDRSRSRCIESRHMSGKAQGREYFHNLRRLLWRCPMKWIDTALLSTLMLTAVPIAPVLAETSDGPETMWVCPQSDGTTVYTNKERAGCHALTLKPLGMVPDVGTMPSIPRATTDTAQHRDSMHHDRISRTSGRPVPDWAREWYSSIAPSGSVQEEVCSLYSEWMHLVQKTRGGFSLDLIRRMAAISPA